MKETPRLDETARSALAQSLRSPRYELVPTPSALPAALRLPRGSTVTVTASPRKGIEATVELAIALADEALRVVPHIAARHVRDRRQVEDALGELSEAGISELFVVGGDGPPRGEFGAAIEVIELIEASDHNFDLGIAGYPEGHPYITDAVLTESLRAKQTFASLVITQMCFDAGAIIAWIGEARRRGVDLPVYVGIPGPVSLARLIPVATRIGVGDSLRFLTRHRGLLRTLTASAFSPTQLLVDLAPALASPAVGVAGIHIYSFNQIATTEEWRQELLQDLEG